MRRLGVGFRAPLANWICSRPPEINCLEITAEHFFDRPDKAGELRQSYPLMLHGLGLSLGTPGPLDQSYLERFAEVCRYADPDWVSEHIAFTKTQHVDLGHLNPIPYSNESLEYFSEHVIEVSERCNKPIVLENITSHINIKSPMRETEFMNRLCDRTGCGLLLDVTNLYVNSKNHAFDPMQWLIELQPEFIRQLHVVGYTMVNNKYYDTHGEAIQPEIYQLIEQVINYSSVSTVILERDQNFPDIRVLSSELQQLGKCLGLN